MLSWRSILILAAILLVAGCGDSTSETDGNAAPSPVDEAQLYAAAQRAEQQGQPREAIEIYRRILREFPDSPENYKAEFLIGFVYAEELNVSDSARVIFERVIKNYPGTEFVDDAQAMLQFLDGKMPEFEETSSL